MTQKFIVTVNGTVVTEDVSGCSVSKQMNRFYDVATFDTALLICPKDEIVIEYGDDTFTGFIYKSTKSGKNNYRIECRTEGGYLTTPFISTDTHETIPATTSHTLCAYYASKYGITITITAEDLDFGGDYEQNGTVLTALTTIANSTGAEFWWDGSAIRIEPNKWIESQGAEIPPADIFDYVPFAKTIEQRGVGTIIVGNKSAATDKVQPLSCTATVDGCTAQAMIRVIPHDAYEYSTGLNSVSAVQTPMVHKGVLSTSSYLSLEADIVSISSVTVNNRQVSDYTFVNNTIIFST